MFIDLICLDANPENVAYAYERTCNYLECSDHNLNTLCPIKFG